MRIIICRSSDAFATMSKSRSTLLTGLLAALAISTRLRMADACGSYISTVLSNCSYARITVPNGKASVE